MSAIKDLVKYSNKCYEKGFVSATDGNLSVRLDDYRIAITKSGICKGDVEEKDIIVVDLNGNKLDGEGQPSSEVKIHLLAYNSRKEINSVVHCHPVYSTAFATSENEFEKPYFPEVVLTIGVVPLCEYGTPSTNELPNSMKPYINSVWAMLLQNHGAVTFGDSVQSAYNRMEKLEHAAKTIVIAKLLGNAKPMSDVNLRKLYSIAQSSYGITPPPIENYDLYSHAKTKYSKNNSFLDLIDERLRARAGNPAINVKKYTNH